MCLLHHSMLLLMLHLFFFFFILLFLQTDQTSCPCCGDSVWSALDDECLWFPFMLFFKKKKRKKSTKQNVRYQVVFFCHLFHNLPKKKEEEKKKATTLMCSPPPPHPFLPPPPAHEVHWQCTTHNEGSLHASMKFNLRCEWMTEKSCRLWFILMKLYFKTAPHGRACWAATEFLITYKLRVF